MPHLLLSGPWDRTTETLAALIRHGFSLTLAPAGDAAVQHAAGSSLSLAIALLVAGGRAAPPRLPVGEVPWLAVDLTDDPHVIATAYAAGALAVLPACLSEAALVRAIENTLAMMPSQTLARSVGLQRFQCRSPIDLRDDEVLKVEEGVVAQYVTHRDGGQGLLGLWGPGQVLVEHPLDGSHLCLVAHTDVAVIIEPWAQAICDSNLLERLRGRLCQTQTWAAVQSHPHLDDRLMGTLALLGDQFGRPLDGDLLIDLRLTHGMLSMAVGATRATVTRTLQTLRTRGRLRCLGSGAAERYALRRSGRREQLPH